MAGVIQKIRDRAGFTVGIIALAMLIFILTDLLQSNTFIQEKLTGRPDMIARIYGEAIPYREFEALYQNAQRNQPDLSSENRDQLLASVWQEFLQQKLYEKEYLLGAVSVSSDEVLDLFVGEEPHPIILQIFSQGGNTYDRDKVRNVLQQAPQNPELQAQLAEIENYLVRDRMREKYLSLLKNSAYVPKIILIAQNQLDNQKRTFAYLAINYASLPDTAFPVTEGDIRGYYQAHKEEFRLTEPQHTLQYAVFYKEPSPQDSMALKKKLEELAPLFEKAASDSLFATTHTDKNVTYVEQFISEVDEFLRDSMDRAGKVIGPYLSTDGYRLAKVSSLREDTVAVYKIRHILIGIRGDTLAAKKLADSLARITNTTNFAAVANQYSEDFQSKFNGGELGWITPARFGANFVRGIKNLPLKQIKGPIRSDQGFHILEIQDKTSRKVKIAYVVKEIAPSDSTLRVLRQKAQRFASLAEKNFEEAAEKTQVSLRTSPPLRPSNYFLPGLWGVGNLAEWTFSHKKGDFSGVIEVGNAYVVARIVSADENYTSVTTLHATLEPRVRNDKKAQAILAKIQNLSYTDLSTLQANYGSGAYVSRAENVLYGSVALPGLGVEPKVQGTAFGIPLQSLSRPISGNSGVYVVQPLSEEAADTLSSSILTFQIQNQTASRANTFQNKLLSALTEIAKVEDFRYRFRY
ncbi:MAG: peptidylprolyl isomerase [Bacteroidia bacterium]